MSIRSIERVLNHSRSTGTARLVMICIADHDGDGGSWPLISTLAKNANVSERSVQRAISELVAMGELVVHANAGGKKEWREDRRPNCYEIIINEREVGMSDGVTQSSPREADGVTQSSPREADGVTLVAERGDKQGMNGVTTVSPPYKEQPSIEPSIEPGVATATTPTAQALISEWLDHCEQRPPNKVIGHVSKEVKLLLDEGIGYEAVRSGLAAWHQKGLHPSVLASVVNEILNPPVRRETRYEARKRQEEATRAWAEEMTYLELNDPEEFKRRKEEMR